MSSEIHSKQIATDVEPMGFCAVVVRIFWLMGGNLVLFMLAIFIFEGRGSLWTDIAFWGVVGALVLLRYIDITRLKGLTSDSQPATLKHWRLYVIKLLAGSGALWGLAHGIRYVVNH
jgi:hypothetical protein